MILSGSLRLYKKDGPLVAFLFDGGTLNLVVSYNLPQFGNNLVSPFPFYLFFFYAGHCKKKNGTFYLYTVTRPTRMHAFFFLFLLYILAYYGRKTSCTFKLLVMLMMILLLRRRLLYMSQRHQEARFNCSQSFASTCFFTDVCNVRARIAFSGYTDSARRRGIMPLHGHE
ncbi:hypothetical protein BX666DRAFT_1076685 [Dichotomocladium elegans]|nr:hypothetical protein BX666DRAFT_1076685 [Dichotomocladium elegans]